MLDEKMKYAQLLLTELKDGPLSWTELEKKMIRHCGTHWKFTSLMRWLMLKGCIVKEGSRGSRGLYRLNSEKVNFDKDGKISIKI
jgi:hypothetical protein